MYYNIPGIGEGQITKEILSKFSPSLLLFLCSEYTSTESCLFYLIYGLNKISSSFFLEYPKVICVAL